MVAYSKLLKLAVAQILNSFWERLEQSAEILRVLSLPFRPVLRCCRLDVAMLRLRLGSLPQTKMLRHSLLLFLGLALKNKESLTIDIPEGYKTLSFLVEPVVERTKDDSKGGVEIASEIPVRQISETSEEGLTRRYAYDIAGLDSVTIFSSLQGFDRRPYSEAVKITALSKCYR